MNDLLNGDQINGNPDTPIRLAIIGCGQRGKNYSEYAILAPAECKVVAIAEPRPKAREAMASTHNVEDGLIFNTWEDLHKASTESIKATGNKLADAIIVAVQDRLHCEVVLAFTEQGYDILCEKPLATNVGDCIRISEAVKKAGIIFGIGHVLRYSPYSKAMAEVIYSGSLGKLINIQHLEPVGYYHFAHAYVRGAWANEEESTFSLMAKSCHDIDIMCGMISPAVPIRVSSFGSLQHFKKSEKPPAAGSATRCLECPIEGECPYSAKSIYLDRIKAGETGWPVSTLVDGIPDIENITHALQTTSYGKCVYESSNNVVDNQIVNIEFSSGATASFTMVAFTSLICERQTRLHFTHGEIVGDMNEFTVTDFRARANSSSKNATDVEVDVNNNTPGKILYRPPRDGGGHGGGDLGLIAAFVRAVRKQDQQELGVTLDEIIRSHLVVFAAETARLKNQVVDVKEFIKESKITYLPN